jgi:hypothetical protein
VALSDDTAVVGASLTDKTYVFVRSATAWNEQAKLTATDGALGDSFGVSVAVRGDTAVVGAYLDDTTAGSAAGSAYVFVRSGTTWNEQAKLTAPDGTAEDLFGASVAVIGDVALVGAYRDNTTAGSAAGSAYVFVRSGTGWTPRAKLTAPDGAADDQFGFSVALTGRAAVVAAPFDDTPAGFDAGSAYVYWR